MSSQRAFSNWSSFVAQKSRRAAQLKQSVTTRVLESGMIYENEAKQHAPHDLGYHKQQIGFRSINWHTVRLFANAKYAPFLEFGTGRFVDVPKGWDGVAVKFKGSGKKKINLKARPHIIPAIYKAESYLKKKLIEDVKRINN